MHAVDIYGLSEVMGPGVTIKVDVAKPGGVVRDELAAL